MTKMLWSAADLAAATGGEIAGDWPGVTGVSIDTRMIGDGELFVALKGDNRDGHAFVAQALAAGAGAALVSASPEGVAADAPLLIVDDTLKALEAIGMAARARTGAKVIAVTGSVGKTSTKEMLRLMLAGQGHVHAAEKSYNNHWGVPLTLARMPAETDFAVIEIGMNHPGEITPLSRMARPDVALITTVEAVHLAAFADVGEIADAKAEIFAGLPQDGVAVLPADNAHFERLKTQTDRRILSFGETGDLRLIEVTVAGQTTVLRAKVDGQPMVTKIGAPGAHLAHNALGALGAVLAAGADLARAGLALGGWCPPDGRGQRQRILLGSDGLDGEITLIDESYNANPASMRAALGVLAAADVTDNVGRIAKGRRIAFLGDMLELGTREAKLHAELADAMAGVDMVHTCGPLMRNLHTALPREKRGDHAADSRELAARAKRLLDAGDVGMVKGSLGSAMKPVVEAIRAMGSPAGTEEN
ncbi:MAG: UDP-N-acetylmuramoyl-tripeptide--D-alanyl-D-alanine ligase [Pseudomonadota bacterium]